jgi:hypothetical protein
MAKKQVIVTETAAVAAPARAAKPRAPRIKAAQHSKTSTIEPEPVAKPQEANAQEAIGRIAYGYWEARGCQGGSAADDWFRAEREYRQRFAATR